MSPSAGSRGLGRHLDGWPLGLWIVGACALSALLLVPRDVPPDFVPPPTIDRAVRRQELAAEAERARAARAGLPVDVRSVGEAFRKHGRAAFSSPPLLPQVNRQLRRLSRALVEGHASQQLLELRALQAELFVASLGQRSGAEPSSETVELGGGLLQMGLGSGWFEPPPEGADDEELATLFRIYWGEALGIGQQHPFTPTLNEWRVYYRFLLGRPLAAAPDGAGDARRKLGYVAALAQHDQDYPAHLARGILLFQSGAPAESARELQAHLVQHPDGPWTLRAQNHLAACGALLIE